MTNSRLIAFLAGMLVMACTNSWGSDGQPQQPKTLASVPAVGTQIVPEKPIVFRDGRPSAKYRLPSHDVGVVLKHGDKQDVLGARDVFVYHSGSTYYMTYDGSNVNAWLANLATSKDLVHWTKRGAVLHTGPKGSNDSASASYGTTFYDGKTWHMFYLGTPHAQAPHFVPEFPYTTMKAEGHSPTGPWVKQRNVTPFSPMPGTYTSVTASPGQIEKINDQYWMYFAGATIDKDIVKRTIGLAKTSNLNGTWKMDSSPLLPSSEQIEVASLYYQKSDRTWFMFVNHVAISPNAGGVGGVEEYNDAIWVYWTKDPAKWNPDNKAIVVDTASEKWSKTIVGCPSVIQRGNRLAVFYDGLADGSASAMHRDIGLGWVDLPIKTP